MTDDPRIRCLIEAALESGGTAEDLCDDYPELLPEVREQLSRLRRLESHLASLFPPTLSSPLVHGETAPFETKFPQIPGYETEAVLGRGGMGVVYKARHLTLDRTVAIKMLVAGAYAGSVERQRLVREAQAFAALCHPNIVIVHDVGEFDGCPYFTMEYVPGATLAQTLSGTPKPAR